MTLRRAERAIAGIRPTVGAAQIRHFVGVDDDPLAGGDEGRHHDAHAVLELRRLVGGGGRLALDDRVGFDDLERHLVGEPDADRPLLVQFDGDHHPVLEEGGAFADEIARQVQLVIGGGVHEHQAVALGIEELEVLLVEANALHRLRGAEALVELGAVDQVLQFDLVEGAALAGLDRLRLHRHPETAIVLDDHAGLDFVAVDFHETCPCGPQFRRSRRSRRPEGRRLPLKPRRRKIRAFRGAAC
jgi:hypothetical protein